MHKDLKSYLPTDAVTHKKEETTAKLRHTLFVGQMILKFKKSP